MFRQSEITNFLELIKHISEAKDFDKIPNTLKVKKKHRYIQYDSKHETQQKQIKSPNKSQNDNQISTNNKSFTQFNHKMLRISHNIKRHQRQLKPSKFDNNSTFTEQKPSSWDERTYFGENINRVRSNLYQNYCDMIRKKRQEKINKKLIGSQQELANNICNISENTNLEQRRRRSVSKQTSPFVKSKTLKPNLQSIKLKRSLQEGRKKIQPLELNIEPMKATKFQKMPKIQYSGQAGNRLSEQLQQLEEGIVRQNKKEKDKLKEKGQVVHKIGKLDGWAHEEEKSCFNIEYF